jgi:nitrogen regulatory protein PII 1
MISAIVRPEKVAEVMAALMYAGFPSVTKMDVYGRGKQRGIKVGEVNYDELPKELLFTVVKNDDREFVVDTIMKAARTGHKGAFGDGKIFIQAVEESITVSSGERESEPPLPAPVVDAA